MGVFYGFDNSLDVNYIKVTQNKIQEKIISGSKRINT